MNCSRTGFSVLLYIPEFTQTYVQRVSDVIQLSPLSSPSPPAFCLSQHQGLFQWAGSSHQVAKLLELQLQKQSFQWIFRVDFLEEWLVWSPCCLKDSQESSPTPQFKSINYMGCSFSFMIQLLHPYMTTGKTITIWTFDHIWLYGSLSAK